VAGKRVWVCVGGTDRVDGDPGWPATHGAGVCTAALACLALGRQGRAGLRASGTRGAVRDSYLAAAAALTDRSRFMCPGFRPIAHRRRHSRGARRPRPPAGRRTQPAEAPAGRRGRHAQGGGGGAGGGAGAARRLVGAAWRWRPWLGCVRGRACVGAPCVGELERGASCTHMWCCRGAEHAAGARRAPLRSALKAAPGACALPNPQQARTAEARNLLECIHHACNGLTFTHCGARGGPPATHPDLRSPPR
jgi:hypothetical protein